jgi:hypothetical protein
MANKLSAYIDLAKLQGAHRLRLKGKDCIVINLEASRAKISERNPERVNLSLSLVPNREGKDDFGQTHWICEPTTKDERESANPPKFPILGNAREFDESGGQRTARPAGGSPVTQSAQSAGESMTDGLEDDEITF